jgi:hypothetical protein
MWRNARVEAVTDSTASGGGGKSQGSEQEYNDQEDSMERDILFPNERAGSLLTSQARS